MIGGKMAVGENIDVYPRFKMNKKMGNDLAIVKIKPGKGRFDPTTFLEISTLKDARKSYRGSIYGYPVDKVKLGSYNLWGMEGNVSKTKPDSDTLLEYNIDTVGGQSGSPIIVKDKIVGVHTNGDYLFVRRNYGVMLTNRTVSWINVNDGSYSEIDETLGVVIYILTPLLFCLLTLGRFIHEGFAGCGCLVFFGACFWLYSVSEIGALIMFVVIFCCLAGCCLDLDDKEKKNK